MPGAKAALVRCRDVVCRGVGNHCIAQRMPILGAESEALKEPRFRAPAGMADAQQILHNLGRRDDRAIQMWQPWHASSLKAPATPSIGSDADREVQFGCASNQLRPLQARMPVAPSDDATTGPMSE